MHAQASDIVLFDEGATEFGCPCGSKRLARKGYSKPVASIGGERRQRFKCRQCQRTLSANYFSINYRLRHRDLALNAKILWLLFHGASGRAISRSLSISEHCVRIRLGRLSRRALEFHSGLLGRDSFRIREPLAYDGFENFAGSQYDPNNINHLIGRDSLFIYDFNFASLNRKGRTSPWQRMRLAEIESVSGRYNPKSIRIATARILERNQPRCDGNRMQLLSDEHFQYRRALENELAHLPIEHLTVSSKACRNFQNILFSVNHADLIIRQRVAAFARETISFSKNPGTMCQRYALFLIQKNYMLPQFTKRHIRRPHAHSRSPAQAIGLTDRLLGFSDIFAKRSLTRPRSLNYDWQHFFDAQIPPEHRRNPRFKRQHVN